jgi:uroporphyrinogen III methyltransferase/synthase
MNDPREPLVYLVGAGPGSPGLLTVRAVECLALADVVIHDKLVPLRLLDCVPEGCQRICVNSLPGSHPERWPHVHQAMIDLARQGKRVVRLKGGDPFIFGRGGEEAEALRHAGIPFEVVPGVTSALAAAACSGIPLTHRIHASAVAFITGHEYPGKHGSNLDWSALARFPGTLVIYMGISRLPQITQALIEHGKSPEIPAAAIQWASIGDQQTVEAALGDLAAAVQSAGLAAPAIVVIGPVARLRDRLKWFEDRPLFGKRILVTRPRQQAGDLVRRLEQLGAVPLILPSVEIRPPEQWEAVDRAVAALPSFHWLVFTSVNGVHSLIGRIRHLGRDLRWLGGIRLAAIGPATADALRSYHLEPDLVPAIYNSEGLAAALRDRAAGQRVLLARADRGRDLLRQELAAVAQVEQIAVYSQVDSVDPESEAIDCLRRGEIDYVTLTSSNIARALIASLDATCRERIASGAVRLVTISPETSRAVARLGLPVAAEATIYTTNGLIDALIDLSRRETQLPV